MWSKVPDKKEVGKVSWRMKGRGERGEWTESEESRWRTRRVDGERGEWTQSEGSRCRVKGG